MRRCCRGVGRVSAGRPEAARVRRRQGGLWWSGLLGIGRGRDRMVRPAGGSPFSAGGGGVLVGADDGGVDLDEPVDVASRVGVGLDLLECPGEHAVQGVTAEAGVDRLPRPVAFRQVTPGDPGPDLVNHPVDDLPVRHPRPARRGPRYQWSE